MDKVFKAYCVGHTLPLFTPGIPYEMLCPASLGIPNEVVIDDARFGSTVDGGSLAEYSQLFGLAPKIHAGDVVADRLFLFQYRKFISTTQGGAESVWPWIRVLDSNNATPVFPSLDQLRAFTGRLAVGSIFDFGESIAANYSRVHVGDDFSLFIAACAQSDFLSKENIKSFVTLRGIIPSPAVCYVDVDLFLRVIEILEDVWRIYTENYAIPRQGYQRRVSGYLLERLHSFLLCKWLMDGSEPDIQVWQRYVVTCPGILGPFETRERLPG